MAEHARTIRIATFTAADGHLDGLIDATRSNARDAAAADGCFGAQVLRDNARPDVVTVISRWRDQASLDRFLGEHEQIAHRAVAGLIVGAVSSRHYTAQPD